MQQRELKISGIEGRVSSNLNLKSAIKQLLVAILIIAVISAIIYFLFI